MNHDTRAALARIFEEWQRRYQADPAAFLADDPAHALEPRTYGEQAADTFIRIGADMGEQVVA